MAIWVNNKKKEEKKAEAYNIITDFIGYADLSQTDKEIFQENVNLLYDAQTKKTSRKKIKRAFNLITQYLSNEYDEYHQDIGDNESQSYYQEVVDSVDWLYKNAKVK